MEPGSKVRLGRDFDPRDKAGPEVLVVRVHPELLLRQKLPDRARGSGAWKRRYREINNWERYLTDNGFKVVKIKELNAEDIHLVFAELKDPVRRKIERYELTRTIDPRHFFPTVESAVAAFRERSGRR